jgi:hypothetical protein
MFLPQINFHEGICLTWFSNQFLRLVRAFRNFEAVEAGELDGGSESGLRTDMLRHRLRQCK